MYHFYLAAMDLLPSAILLIPIYFILNKLYFHNIRKSIFYFIFSCYLSVVYVLVGLPNVTYIRAELNLNLIPFAGMIDDLKNSFLNILLFIPLGITLPLLWSKFITLRSTLLFGFGVSLTIEILQMLTFRATDVNDLITNTLGVLVGFISTRHLHTKYHFSNKDTTRDLGIVILVVSIVMFFLYPFASAALWDLILK